MVSEMKERRFTAVVLSGESAIVSYSLLKAAWNSVEGDVAFPPVFVLEPWLHSRLKSLDQLPNSATARGWISASNGKLLPQGSNILVLDDHAHTGMKYVRQQDFFYKAGFVKVTFGFLATHPNSMARRIENIGYESEGLVKFFQELGGLLHNHRTVAFDKISLLVKALQNQTSPCLDELKQHPLKVSPAQKQIEQ